MNILKDKLLKIVIEICLLRLDYSLYNKNYK